MGFVHELEKFIHHSLEKTPMGLEKTRILADDVHDVGGNDSLVILAALLFYESKQFPDYKDQEPFLHFFIWYHSERQSQKKT